MEEPMEIDVGKPKTKSWSERYRPKTLDDIVHQEEVITMLKGALQGKDLPHLLFYGPPGTGKTSTALAFCRQLFPKSIFHDRVLDMNSSDERGISVVREKIHNFSKKSLGPASVSDKCVKLKIIILDEVDAMTKEAQAAMRRVIEDYSKTTRFILICNYVSRLIPPIVSRCAKFRFKSLPAEVQVQRLHTICNAEGTPMSDDELRQVMEYAEGDLRRAVGTLQALAPIHFRATRRREPTIFAADRTRSSSQKCASRFEAPTSRKSWRLRRRSSNRAPASRSSANASSRCSTRPSSTTRTSP